MALEILNKERSIYEPDPADMMEVDDNVTIQMAKPHPLLIDHVIENILHHLIQEKDDISVLDSRLVCHLWDEIATRALRSHSNTTIHFGKYFRCPEALVEFSTFLDSPSSYATDNFPIGKFYLCEDIFKSCHYPIVQKFFTDCSTLLTSLTIRLDDQSDLKASQVAFDSLSLPNLKSLVVDDRRKLLLNNNNGDNNNVVESDSESPATLLEGLVKCSSNLRKLTVIHPPSSMYDDEETLSNQRDASERTVAEMLKKHCPKKLNYLNLDIKLNDNVLVTLSEVPVCLSELQLSLRESIFSKESLNKLLDIQKDSLRTLRFCSMGAKSHFEITFPIIPNLQLLELHSWDSQLQGVTFSNFTYKQYFPSLKSLVLHTWAEHPSWIQFFPAAYYGTVPTLTSLKLPQNFMYPAMIQNLSWLYPNLKRLDLHFSKETTVILQRVFAYFSDHLEELRIRDSLPREKFDVCLDPLFTGLPVSVCDKILRLKAFDANPEQNHLLNFKQRPSLLNLKNLRKLDIDEMLRHETYVTDVTGYLILLQMPSLRYLNMGRSQIDDECLGLLANKYPTNMKKELLVPKPPPKKNLSRRNKTLSNSIKDCYCSSLDLINNCMIS